MVGATTRMQAANFNAQSAVERLETELAEVREDIAALKLSTAGIQEIKENMVTVQALDLLMQKYFTTQDPSSATGTEQSEGITSQQTTHPTPVVPSTSDTVHEHRDLFGTPLQNSFVQTSVQHPFTANTMPALSAIFSYSNPCMVTRTASAGFVPQVIHPHGIHIPSQFQIPPIPQPPPRTFDNPQFLPNPGTWSVHSVSLSQGGQHQQQQPYYNTVTGQYLPSQIPIQRQQHPASKTPGTEYDRNEKVYQMGGTSYYADAVLKGPRLEIPLFAGEDPIGWLQQCEKFFDMSGTPLEQWVNIASGHFCGKANVWLKNICIPWQMVNWQQFCQMIADRFTQANAHEAVEMLKNLQQQSSVLQYIDQFEECVQLVKRDHPYLQEAFIMSCFIGGLRAEN